MPARLLRMDIQGIGVLPFAPTFAVARTYGGAYWPRATAQASSTLKHIQQGGVAAALRKPAAGKFRHAHGHMPDCATEKPIHGNLFQ
jgi:hypothetical protein